ncbi:MAG: acyltransferase [Peptococcaceae bacterium]|nr:acyltransferase [Peptococcaceae bacterium]
MKKKINEIETLRGLCFLAVVTQHILGYLNQLSGLSYSNIVFLSIVLTSIRFAIPTFVFITGFVLFYNYFDHINLDKYLSKRIKDTLIPYLCWTILFTVYSAIKLEKIDNLLQLPMTTLLNFIKGTGMYHLWYIAMILQMYFLFPLIRQIFLKVKNHLGYLVVLFALLDLSISAISAHLIPLFLTENDPNWLTIFFTKYRHLVFLSWIFYFTLGGYAAINYPRYKKWISDKWLWIALIFSILTLYLVNNTLSSATIKDQGYTVNFNITAPLNLNMLVYSLFSILLLYYLSILLTKKYSKISLLLEKISLHSYGAYLIHPVFISLVCKSTSLKWNLNFYLQFTADLILCCGLSLMTSYLLGKIPIVKTLLLGSKSLFVKKSPV